MVDPVYTTSAAVTTLFVLAVVVWAARSRSRNGYDPIGKTTALRLRETAREPAVWMASFLLLAFAFGGGAVLYVSDVTVPGRGLLAPGLLTTGVAVFAGAMFVGVYQSARSRGGSAAQGVAEGSFLVGLLVVVAIAAKLVV